MKNFGGVNSMWNKVYFNESKGRLEGFPKRCDIEDIVFVVGDDLYTGYFDDSINYENPEDSDFGFYTEDDPSFFEADSVSCWCYKGDLITSAKGE